ncbi:DUF4062 domain-containing protein [Gallibacter sp. Marseille-QA0791]|uniref:DUF4062 domain-containing protein n=1 Tax=Gallibacter sp. Marseille-QA0791 TaxID=3378781 RepID=UPI003D12D62E
MERKYQVFISSTYEDLKTERQAAISCLLDMNCIPVGMEQFPASSLSQWEYIKKMIDMSDYYLLIVAGKYGSIDPEENISYTEKEYRYAIHKKMPILAFLHKNIDSLPAIKVGATDEERERVKNFHNTVKEAGRLVNFYSNEDELKYKIAMAMPKIINDAPMPGWVRADQAEKAIATAGDTDGIRDLQRQLEKIQNTILEKVEQTQMKWEPISKEEVDAMFSSEKKELKIPILSDEAKCLLTEAAKDAVGQILVINSLEGVDIQTNNKIMNTDKIGKSATIWKKAVSELQNNQLIMAVGNKNEIFQLTRLGYEVSEKI